MKFLPNKIESKFCDKKDVISLILLSIPRIVYAADSVCVCVCIYAIKKGRLFSILYSRIVKKNHRIS
jgi:hypothetical protein